MGVIEVLDKVDNCSEECKKYQERHIRLSRKENPKVAIAKVSILSLGSIISRLNHNSSARCYKHNNSAPVAANSSNILNLSLRPCH